MSIAEFLGIDAATLALVNFIVGIALFVTLLVGNAHGHSVRKRYLNKKNITFGEARMLREKDPLLAAFFRAAVVLSILFLSGCVASLKILS